VLQEVVKRGVGFGVSQRKLRSLLDDAAPGVLLAGISRGGNLLHDKGLDDGLGRGGGRGSSSTHHKRVTSVDDHDGNLCSQRVLELLFAGKRIEQRLGAKMMGQG